jgi:hypothetical protein
MAASPADGRGAASYCIAAGAESYRTGAGIGGGGGKESAPGATRGAGAGFSRRYAVMNARVAQPRPSTPPIVQTTRPSTGTM